MQVTGDGKAVVVDHVAWSVANDAPLFAGEVATAVGDVLVVDRARHVRITTSTGKDFSSPGAGELTVLQVSDAVFALATLSFDVSSPSRSSLYDVHTGRERAQVPVPLLGFAPISAVRLDGDAFAVLVPEPHGIGVVVVSVADPDHPVADELQLPGCDL